MIDSTPKPQRRKGGRPRLPDAPQNAGDVRRLIATEVVRTNPRVRSLAAFYKLLKAFERADAATAADLKTKALTDANELKTAELELRRAEYQRRFDLGPLGIRNLHAENERLKQRNAELESSSN